MADGLLAARAPYRLQVNRRKVTAGCDAPASKRGLHSIAVDAFGQADYVDKPTERAVRERKRRALEAGYTREKGIVTFRSLTAKSENLIDSPQLNPAERTGQL